MNPLAGLTRRLDDLYQKRWRAEEARIPSYQRQWLLSDIDYEIDGLEEELALIEGDDDDRSRAA